MTVANETMFNQSDAAPKISDKLIMFSYAGFALVILCLIYAASGTPGTYDAEIAAMSVFP